MVENIRVGHGADEREYNRFMDSIKPKTKKKIKRKRVAYKPSIPGMNFVQK